MSLSTNKTPGQGVPAAEWNEAAGKINELGDTSFTTFNASIPFNKRFAIMNAGVVSGLVLTPNTINPVFGAKTILRLVANGTDTPSFAGFAQEAGSDTWNTAIGTAHNITMEYNGYEYSYTIKQLLDPSQDFILNNYITARAFSLRKLKNNYLGSAVRVRRSSDNAEQNIGFSTTGEFDIVAFSAFVGGGDGFVTTWYDQSGNSQHALQATAAKQPKIILGGIHGSPTVQFDGANDILKYPSVWSGASPRSIFAVYKNLDTASEFLGPVGGQYDIVNTVPATGSFFEMQVRQPGAIGHPYLAGYSADLTDSHAPDLNAIVASVHYNGTNGFVRRNGAQVATGPLTLNTGTGAAIGGDEPANSAISEYAYIQISELIITSTYTSGMIPTLEALINQYYAIY